MRDANGSGPDRRRPVAAMVAAVVAAVAVLVACAEAGETTPDEERLRVAVPELRPTLQPRGFLGYSIASYGVAEQLLRPEPDGTATPWLLESYTRDDPTRWRLTLRSGVSFHNGNPVDAAAVVAALTRQAEGSYRQDAISTGQLRVTDQLEFTLTTPEPTATVPEDLAGVFRYYIVYDVAALDAAGDNEQEIVAAGIYTGPYRPIRADGQRIVAARFEEYWGESPHWSELEIIPMTDPQSRVAAVRSGEVDIALTPPAAVAATLADDARVRYRTAETANHGVFAQLNLGQAPFDDPAVRRAFMLGVDYERLAGEVADGLVYTPARGLYPSELPFAEATQQTDPTAAAAALDAAGWQPGPDGIRVRDETPLRVNYLYESTRSEHEDIGVALQGQLRPLGLDVVLTQIEDAYDSEGWPPDWSITAVSLTLDGSAPAEVIGGWLGRDGLNFGGVHDDRLDELVVRLRQTDPPDRSPLLREVQHLVADEAYAVVLAFRPTDAVVRAELDWFTPDPQYLFLAPELPVGG
ncbi:hypothetical protein JQS43_11315 [Natronosporangium hydrolyticum]|uniref:Solute-binding protein family 5 domain-containing protein n=1 Tax=Natronosporangium hydrolyticum TaxID=2811111 RepID=A0A895YG17_9ACTN|nr:ABC transporter substrate-binding protein [Natronosporangium hydrolyticum]QSB16814.1 hypothetical protein JQS43_11315 [Natronosporangium hydrolyticum]